MVKRAAAATRKRQGHELAREVQGRVLLGGSIRPFRSMGELELGTESAEWSRTLPVRSEVLRWNRWQDA